MATMSITSNDGPLARHLLSSRYARQIRNITNPHCVLNRQAAVEGRPRSGSMTRILISSSSINGRNATNSGFETILVVQRLAAGGNIGLRTSSQFGAARGVIAIANAAVAPR